MEKFWNFQNSEHQLNSWKNILFWMLDYFLPSNIHLSTHIYTSKMPIW